MVKKVIVAAALAALSMASSGNFARASQSATILEKTLTETNHSHKTEALKQLLDYLKHNRGEGETLCLCGELLIDSNRLPEAKIMLDRAIKVDPGLARSYGMRAYCYISQKNYPLAYGDLKNCISLWQCTAVYPIPEIGTFKNMILLCRKLGKPEEAIQYQKALKLVQMVTAARDCREAGMIQKSLSLLQEALEAKPELDYALLLRAAIYDNLGKYDQAIADLNRLILHQPTFLLPYYLRGDCYFEQNNLAKALASWQSILTIHQRHYPDVVGFGYVALTGRFREQTLNSDDIIVNRADIDYLCGTAAVRLGLWQKALDFFSAAIKLDHLEYSTYLARARVYEHLDKRPQALSDLTHTLTIKADCLEALLERARYYERTNNGALALADLSAVIKLDPRDFGSYILKAQMESRLKQYQAAIADYTTAIKLNPREDDCYIGRADAYAALHQYDLALTDYKKALILNPREKTLLNESINRLKVVRRPARAN